MPASKYRPVDLARRPLSYQIWFIGILMALLLAMLAFANAVAGVGYKIPMFAPFGAGFYNKHSDSSDIERQFAQAPRSASQKRFSKISLELLRSDPTSSRALRNFGLHREAVGDLSGATKAFMASDAMTLRDPVTQIWLSDKAAQRNDIDAAFTHLDQLLRVKPESSEILLQRLASATTDAGARRAITRFVRRDNPWFSRFIETATAQPKLHWAIAQLLVDANLAPSNAELRTPYSQIIQTLASEQRFDLLKSFYPMLPGARVEYLRDVSFDRASFESNYPPVQWDFGQSSDRGGNPTVFANKNALEIYGLADTRGIAARKLFLPVPGVSMLSWSLAQRIKNDDSHSQWILKCFKQGVDERLFRSRNLFETRLNKTLRIDFPLDCDAVVIELFIDGGTGTSPATLVFNSITVR